MKVNDYVNSAFEITPEYTICISRRVGSDIKKMNLKPYIFGKVVSEDAESFTAVGVILKNDMSVYDVGFYKIFKAFLNDHQFKVNNSKENENVFKHENVQARIKSWAETLKTEYELLNKCI